jgi:CRISPR/Cas system-associated exonuclease Cas4 (RecB family)
MSEIKFNAGNHQYILNGKIIPSVTEIIRLGGLISYNANTNNEWYMLRGKYLHQAIQLFLQDNLDRDALDPQLEPYLSGFEKFMSDTSMEIQGYEQPLYHSLYLYAGTPDIWGRLNGSTVVIDVKTGSPAKWHVLQLAAYAELLKASGTAITSGAILYLSKNSYKLTPVSVGELQRGLSVFLSALTVSRWKEEL